jgi:2-C-methyl-D-erythritol 4-phosphate cytidylyltransferase
MVTRPPTPRTDAGARRFALVPCAGVGERSGADGPKQYAELAGRPLVAHTLAALQGCPLIDAVLVALAPQDSRFAALLPDAGCWVAHCGGPTRAATVTAGLQALRQRGACDHDWVLVHDAARCLLRPAWVERLVQACGDDGVGGLLALPVADTLKRQLQTASAPGGTGGAGGPRAAVTVDRRGLWAAQTPQMFRLGLLERALAAAGDGVTDEASAVERLGLTPLLVAGELENLKVTWPADFALAGRLLETR